MDQGLAFFAIENNLVGRIPMHCWGLWVALFSNRDFIWTPFFLTNLSPKVDYLRKLSALELWIMGNITMTSETLERYFDILNGFDNNSKEKLIKKLEESLHKEKKSIDPQTLFGAWEDDKTSDVIIKEIRESRVEKRETTSF